MRHIENTGVKSMQTATIQFKDLSCRVYIAEYEDLYIISIPELAFSMAVERSLTDEEIAEEVVIHLFTICGEADCRTAANVIQSVIKTEQGDNNGN